MTETEVTKAVGLLPCPFCGGEARIIERPQSSKDTGFFCAISCFCGGYSAHAHQHGIAETEEAARSEAITAWNTRTQSAAQNVPVLLEALWTPPEEAWYGLARALMMAFDMECKTPRQIFQHLDRTGNAIPQWLRDEPEMTHLDHVPSKGTRVVIIYRAMLEPTFAAIAQAQEPTHER